MKNNYNDEPMHDLLLDKNSGVRAVSVCFFTLLGIAEGLVAGYFIWH